jgi:hypothetical protein
MILTKATTPTARHLTRHRPPLLATGQKRTLLGLVHAIDKRVYRWARGVLPPISKTENIALGCGTIGELVLDTVSVCVCVNVAERCGDERGSRS